jgi:hypothetical protein
VTSSVRCWSSYLKVVIYLMISVRRLNCKIGERSCIKLTVGYKSLLENDNEYGVRVVNLAALPLWHQSLYIRTPQEHLQFFCNASMSSTSPYKHIRFCWPYQTQKIYHTSSQCVTVLSLEYHCFFMYVVTCVVARTFKDEHSNIEITV